VDLCEAEGRRTLEEGGQRRGVGRAANVLIGQRRKQAERRDETRKEKRQNRQPISAIGAAMRDQQAQQGDADCDCRNQ